MSYRVIIKNPTAKTVAVQYQKERHYYNFMSVPCNIEIWRKKYDYSDFIMIQRVMHIFTHTKHKHILYWIKTMLQIKV